MALHKRVSGNYRLELLNPADVYTVAGNTALTDTEVTIGAENTSSDTVGFRAQKADTTYAGFRWNTPLNRWEISTNNSVFNPLMTKVQDDLTPQLGGNLNTTGYSITSDTKEVTIDNVPVLPNVTSDPVPAADVAKLFSKDTSGGGTGLYSAFKDNGVDTVTELVSKQKAIVYSIIF